MLLAAGTRLGPYEIVSPLGAGGMGEVYRARDTKLGRDVAIKILPDVFVADGDRVARFQREAQVLATLNHPNIAAIYGLDETDGKTAIVLELVEGQTLAEKLDALRAKGSRLPLDEALPIARQIAEALESAHEKGVIHRDLKPANIKITAQKRGESARLRPGQDGRAGRRERVGRIIDVANAERARDVRRCDSRHRRLHESRTGARPTRGQAHRHLGIRLRGLRDARGQADLRRRRYRQ